MREVKVYTIGFTKKSAAEFFNLLISNRVKKIIDIRLNNSSQLAGFTKGKDLAYFLKTISNIEYVHKPEYAPTKELLNDYKKGKTKWADYETAYLELLHKRHILDDIDYSIFENACLLCSEPTAEKCHRRLFANYLSENNSHIKVIHI